MREIRVVQSDDLTFHETGERVPATDTVVLSVRRPDSPKGKVGGGRGVTVELDLTDDHGAELDKILGRYLDAGHAPGQDPRAETSHPPRTPESYQRMVSTREFRKGLRKWMEATGREYRTPSGSYYYPTEDQEAYREHLAGQQG